MWRWVISLEITYTTSLSAYKADSMSSPIGRAVTGAQANMTGTVLSQGTALIGVTSTAFPLAQVTQPGWAWFSNLDSSNFFQLMSGPTGQVICRFFPGYSVWMPLDPTCTPYGLANTAPVLVEYVILSL
jgi:hypothetical protein